MIEYMEGSALDPVLRPAVIAHVVNDANRFGSGFAGQMAEKWPHAKALYHEAFTPMGIARQRLEPGKVLLVSVPETEQSVWIAHLCAQHGLKGPANPHPLDLNWLYAALCKLHPFVVREGASVHMPRIGTDRGGRIWAEVEPVIQAGLPDVPVIVYDLPR